MKIKSVVFLLVLLVSMAQLSAQNKYQKTVVFDVPMKCEKCKKAIEGNISFEKGVKDLTVFLDKNKVSVTYDERKTNPEKIQEAFKKIDRPATLAAVSSCSAQKQSEAKAAGSCATKEQKSCSEKKSCSKKKSTVELSGSCGAQNKKESCCKSKESPVATASLDQEKAPAKRKRAESCCGK